MKKFILFITLTLITFAGFSQTKGISYQAVIIDPNPIELPGQDIVSQPYVSKDVWIKFGIYSGSTLQYEELQKTKTDEYGLVNLVIGSGINTGQAGTFTSLSWDGLTKNIVTSVSFDKGAHYTQVSNQHLNYVPYAFYAEAAGRLSGVLQINQGGTGATNAVAARANLGLGNVDNTADADKPISLATLAILDVKESLANKSQNIVADSASIVKYPSVKAIKDYIDSRTSSNANQANQANNANLAAKATALATPRTINGVPFDGTANISIPVGVTPPDADATTKGLVQLAGDLSGTAAAPTIATGAVTTAKIADGSVTTGKLATSSVTTAKIADASVTDTKIVSVAGSKVAGNIAGNAATATLANTAFQANNANLAAAATKLATPRNINGVPFDGTSDITITTSSSTLSGTIAIANGGTGATTAAGARTNLGLAIGTDVLAQRTFGSAANNNTADFVATTEKGANNGVATLGNNGKIPSAQIPAISFQNVNVVNSDASMIAISGAQVGSIAIRTDNNQNYVLSALPASTLSNWIALATPLYVSTVNGYAGPNVSLTTNDIAEGSTNKYYTDARARNSISAVAPLNYNATTGVLSMTAASTNTSGYLSASDFATFNNKQTALTAGVDYATPGGNITGNAANVTGIVSIANGGTGTSTATGALANLGAEPTANKSNDIAADAASTTKFPSVKSIKDYVDQQSANAGVADNSITSAKINGTISIAKGGTGASTAAAARTNLGLAIGTDVLAPNASITAATKTKITYDTKGLVTAGADATTADIAPSTNRNYVTDVQAGVISNTSGVNTGDETATTIKSKLGISTLSGSNTGDQTIALTGDVTGSGTGTFATTINTVGGVSSATIASLPTSIAANTASITALNTSVAANTSSITSNTNSITALNTSVAANTSSITGLNTSVAANTSSITSNTNSIATLTTNVNANTNSITALNTSVAANTSSITSNTNSIATLTTNVNSNTSSITSLNTNVAANTASITALNTSVAANTASITSNTADIALKAPIASPNLTGTPTAPTATAGTNTTQLATTAFVNTAVSNYTPTISLGLAGGLAGNIPYQTAPGTTGFIPNGAANQFLTSTGSGTYTWTSASGVTGNFVPYTGATQAVNLGAYDLTVNGLTVGTGVNGSTLSNTAFGVSALASNNSGLGKNTALGYFALNKNTSGQGNTAVGYNALLNNVTRVGNTAIGTQALEKNIADGNTAVGNGAGSLLDNTLFYYNTFLGYNAGARARGQYNIAIGNLALLMNNSGTTGTGGDNNIAIGNNALWSSTKPVSNVVIGDNAGYGFTVGSWNTILGQRSGYDITGGYHNTILGDSTGLGITTGSRNTIIGAKVTGLSPTLTGNIILADGAGNIRAQHNGTSWNLGVIGAGTWSGTVIGSNYGGAGSANGLLKANGTGVVSAAISGTDYLVPNAAITAATKTKITYDAKGLVTAGADATTADIAPSTNRNYVTDAQAGVLSNTSGVNTGDQTISLTGDVTGSGNGSFATTINTVGGVSSSTIATLPTSIAANTSSITTLNTSVAANTASITQNIADINLKAPIASPNLTGTPTAPTATAGTNTTQLATTAFVNTAVSNFTPTTTLNVSGGVAGNILYQTAPGTTGFIPNGTANQFLTSTGSGTYTWTAASNVTGNFVPYTGATGAVNLGAYDLTVNGLTIGKGSGADASNTAVGNQALKSTVIGGGASHWGTLNTAYGNQSLYSNISGFSNTGIGNGALKSNTTGSWNVGLGYNALTASIAGGSNVGLGTGAFDQLTTGSDNIGIGTAAGRSYGAGSNLTSVNNSIFIGSNTKAKASAGTNEIVIGFGTTGNGSNTVTIGNSSVTDNYFTGNINLTGNVSGGTWSGTVIANKFGGAGTTNGILKANGTGLVSAAISGTDYLVPNATITAATKTKITYDANGLITAGADATTADIAASTNRNYVTDAQAGVISNTSGINTGDETASTIKTKLGITTLSGSNTGDQTIALTGDVSGSGTGTFTTTVNTVGGVSSATIATLPTSIAANTSSITALNTSVAANTSSITSNTNSIASLTSSVNTLTGNVTATTNNYLTSIPNLAQVGTITSGIWSGTTIDIAHGGTGATTAAGARTNLGLVIGTNVLAPNAAITAATKTKITYDANGLVTAGADATTADIAASTNRNYVTDAQAGVISNTSGINTGDETASTIKTKLGITTLSGSNTGDQIITLTGDVTGTGVGTFTSTLANTGVAANTYGSATLVPVLTVDAKGRITSASTTAINGGVNTMTAIAATSNVNGATISGTALTLTPADASNGGVVTNGTQTFAGAKTFNADIIVNGVTIGNGKNNLTDNTIIGNGAFANNSAAGIDNTVVGYNALKSSTSGNNNTVVGSKAMSYATSTGSSNSAFGFSSLFKNTSGSGNTSIGESSLYYNTTGYNNVAIGQSALQGYISNGSLTGNDNIGIGNSSMGQLFGGKYNIGIGSNTLAFNSNGNNNIGIGYQAGTWYGANSTTQTATSLANSIFIGHDSRPLGSSDVNQIVIANSPGALGSGSYGQIGLGSHSTLIGNNLTQQSQIYGALTVVPNTALTNTAGASSTIAGQDATTTGYAGGGVTIIAGNGVGTGNGGNVTIKPGTTGTGTAGIINLNGQIKITGGSPAAGSVLTSDATGLATWSSASGSGVSTLTYTSATSYATGGTISGSTLTLSAADASNPGLISTGAQTIAGTKTFNSDLYVNGARVGLGNGNLITNTALGVSALNSATAGSNTAIGYYSLFSNTSGTTNTAVGSYALKINSTGSRNTALGDNTLNLNTASDNTALGSSALKNNTTGSYNVAVGPSSIFYNQTGSNNTAVGYQSLYSNSAISTNDNTAIGYITLAQNATGSNNTVVGSNAGYRFYGAAHNVAVGYASLSNNNNGNYNTALGDNSGPAAQTYTSSNSIFIGASAIPKGLAASTDEIVIGTNATGLGSNTTLIGNTTTQQSQIYGALTVVANTAAANMTGTSSTIAAQNATSATYGGGNLNLTAGNGVGTGNGGNVTITPGTTGTGTAGIINLNGQVKITGGTPGVGKVLTSDANGLASWSTAASAGVSTLTYTAATSYATGGTISGSTLTLAAADVSNPGLISTGTQTIAGAKTFNTDLTVNGITAGRGLGNLSSNTAFGSAALAANTTGYNNTAIGVNTLNANTTTWQNTAVGYEALKVNAASNNTAIGTSVLAGNITGTLNSAIGNLAMTSNTSGSNNTALGGMALRNNLTGDNNTAIGQSAGIDAKGSQNVFLGSNAGYKNTTVSNNIMVGYNAGAYYGSGSNTNNNLTGNGNVLIGNDVRPLADGQTNQIVIAGYTGSGDGMIGNGSNSTTIGNASTTSAKIYGALTLPSTTASTSSTTGALIVAGGVGIASNTYIGGTLSIAGGNPGAGKFLTSDANGLASWTSVVTGASTLTYSALSYANGGTISGTTLTLAAADVNNPGLISTTSQAFTGLKTFNDGVVVSTINTNNANANIAFGYYGLGAYQNGTGSKNVAIGANAMGLGNSRSGNSNVAIGEEAMATSTSGDRNVGIGRYTLWNNTGSDNIGIGNYALNSNTSGSSNIGIGINSMSSNTTGQWNTAVGSYSLVSNTTGSNSTAYGFQALNKNTTGGNDAFGYTSMFYNTTGTGNAAFGSGTLSSITTGNYNVAVGRAALRDMTTSTDNVAIGYGAGSFLTSDASNYGGNVFIGSSAGTYLSDGTSKNTTGYNSIYIGKETTPLVNGGYNEIIIANKINPATYSGQVGGGSNSTTIGNSNTTKAIIYASSSLSNLPATASSGNGGDFTLKAQDAYATGNNNGGNIVLTPGAGANSGISGKITANGILSATSIQNTPIGSVTASTGDFTRITGSGVISVFPSAAAANADGGSSTISAQSASSGTKIGGTLNLWAGDGTGGGNGGDVYIQPGSSSTVANKGSLLVNTTNKSLISSYSPAGVSILVPAGHDGFTLKSEADGNNVMNLWQYGTNSTNMIAFHKGTSVANVVGTINVSTTATSYNTTSDYRLKTDFKDFMGSKLLDSIKVYDYQWKVDGSRSYGVKAHELQSVLPYAVSGKKDAVNADGSINPQTVDYSKIVPVLIKAVQEQEAVIKEAQKENTSLRSELDEQKKRLERLEKLLEKVNP